MLDMMLDQQAQAAASALPRGGALSAVRTAKKASGSSSSPSSGGGLLGDWTQRLLGKSSHRALDFALGSIGLGIELLIEQRGEIGNLIGRRAGLSNDLLAMIDGKFVIYGGDASKDELIDGSDMSLVDNDASGFMAGYLLTDINGDGLVDGSDLAVIDNNAALFISSSTP